MLAADREARKGREVSPTAIRNWAHPRLVSTSMSAPAIAAVLGCSAVEVLGALRHPDYAQVAGRGGWEWVRAGVPLHLKALKDANKRLAGDGSKAAK